MLEEIRLIYKKLAIIIDDFGMQPLDEMTRMMLLEIIEDRHQKSSTIIASQLPVDKWYDVIGESTVADAILDRLVHTSQSRIIRRVDEKKEKRVILKSF